MKKPKQLSRKKPPAPGAKRRKKHPTGRQPNIASRPRSRRKKSAAGPVDPERYHFQLYVTGTTIRSTQAIANIRALCESQLAGRFDLEVIDMYQQPEQAATGQIIAAPTLVKIFPAPLTRVVGNLANQDHLKAKFNLPAGGPPVSSDKLPA